MYSEQLINSCRRWWWSIESIEFGNAGSFHGSYDKYIAKKKSPEEHKATYMLICRWNPIKGDFNFQIH